MCCQKVTFVLIIIGKIGKIKQFTIKATYSAEESASFINIEGTVEEKVSSGLNILMTVT